jgi:hypothetical protein
MKTRTLLSITVLLAVFINGCEKRELLGKQQFTQIITARALGLAYLEENRLKEADAEFCKVIEIAPSITSNPSRIELRNAPQSI